MDTQPTEPIVEEKEEEVISSPETPEEEVVEEAPEPVVPSDPDFVDRSLYNCDNCGGDGLVQDGRNVVHCPQCQGTGKLN